MLKWFKNLKTSTKLISTFIVISILLGAMGIYSLFNLGKMDEMIGFMYEERVVPISDLGRAETDYQRLRVQIRDMVFTSQTKEQKDAINEVRVQTVNNIENSIEKYEKTTILPEEQVILDKLHPEFEEYLILYDKALKYAYANDVEGYQKMVPEFKAAGDKVQGNLKELIDLNISLSNTTNKESDELYNSTRIITITVIILSVLFNIGIGLVISRLISNPLKEISELVEKVSKGDLTETTTIDTKDEIGDLSLSINTMVDSLLTTVKEIIQSAESVSASAQEISATTEEVSSSADTQAHDAQTITELFKEIVKGAESQAHDAQTMKELFRQLNIAIDSVAKNADETAKLGTGLGKVADEGGKVADASIEGMKRVNSQMSLLEKDANRIGDIIMVIDDIASQTNLLALNAAIEAARAGEQGNGFAVVADEVRKLAEQSSNATKEITEIIKGIQDSTALSVIAVAEGVNATYRTGEAFTQIIDMVSRAHDKTLEIATASAQQSAQSSDVMKAIESIASASEQQSAQSSEVMKAVESIAGTSEEAAAASEQTAATSQALANLAEELNNTVSKFKTHK
ncbi:methyl-accepting chemotaxis protein [Niallia taxi]|uniref:methyl-accepting chemotaxis protein n=2 Tax=Niallia taxi TaxID=2499688 RepID=UPI0011A04F81|nr:methyl-accepting chemotaxis protein [Niallia taxi]MCM3213585.1 methyl-accepting chemotaxis protein [Niallia taxi]